MDGYFIFEKANEGDEEVLAILDEFTKQIAAQIVNLQCVIDPQRVAIGGGISAQPLLEKMWIVSQIILGTINLVSK